MTQILIPRVLQNTEITMYDGWLQGSPTQMETENTENWIESLQHIYDKAVNQYQEGHRGHEHVIPQAAPGFLESIGTSSQEIYDFVEDWVNDGEPSFSTVTAITVVRRDYFLHVQKGKQSTNIVETASLPSGREELGGYRWLPRIIAKAQAKLRGEMSPDIMYGCGADRPFLRKVGIEPSEFLRIVWQAGDDEKAVLETVKRYARTLPHKT